MNCNFYQLQVAVIFHILQLPVSKLERKSKAPQKINTFSRQRKYDTGKFRIIQGHSP